MRPIRGCRCGPSGAARCPLQNCHPRRRALRDLKSESRLPNSPQICGTTPQSQRDDPPSPWPQIGGLSGGIDLRKAPCSGPASGAHLGEERTRTSSSPLLVRHATLDLPARLDRQPAASGKPPLRTLTGSARCDGPSSVLTRRIAVRSRARAVARLECPVLAGSAAAVRDRQSSRH